MGKLKCPYCSDATAPIPFYLKATVVLRNKALAAFVDGYPYVDGMTQAITMPESDQPTYGIMVCQSCKKHFVAREETDGWLAVYPLQHRPMANEIPEPIRSEFEEANLCFAIGAYKSCLAICMVALESLWRHQNASGLNDLKTKEVISSRLFDRATEIRLWAGLVKHEFIHEMVTKEETEELLTYLEEILHDVYVQPARLAALTEKRKQIETGK